MTSGANASGSYLPSKIRSSKTDDNYLKELNEDLKLRKQELLEMLKPLEDKNNFLFQKLMSNLEEKQRSLQIMRQIMAGKRFMELLKEAQEMKQNLVRSWRYSRNSLLNRTFEVEELSDQQRAPEIKNKADLQDGNASGLQNDFRGKVIELRIEALKKYQKANDLKLSLYLQQNFEPMQAFLNLPGAQGIRII
uniref:Coiled-coil domain containing 196 n=1 Tax=Aotus nancymaae TaxID=37293 RepID=A0A2K5EJX0_AOTNA